MVMSVIWTALIVISIIASIVGGTSSGLAAAALEGASSAVTLCLSMAGSLCLWSGVCNVMSDAGLMRSIARLMSPVLTRLFPNASKNPEAKQAIAANVSANLLGLGNAATPLGIKAVSLMKGDGENRASDEMCRLIVMNTASIQLIPSTIAAVRASCGSATPFDILPAVWLTSIGSVFMGLIAAYLLQRIGKHG